MTGKRRHDHEHAREDEHQDTLDGEDDEEMQQLKAEVEAMAQRLTEYRESVPHLLTTVLTSHLAAQRPTPITPASASASATMLPPPAPVPVDHLIEGDDTDIQDKLRLFRQKARTNMAAMPRSLQRLQQSIHKLQHIRPSNLHLHPILHTHFS